MQSMWDSNHRKEHEITRSESVIKLGPFLAVPQYVWEDGTFPRFFVALVASDHSTDWPGGIRTHWRSPTVVVPIRRLVVVTVRSGTDKPFLEKISQYGRG